MQCLKCGREIGDERVFCVDCLVMMESNPVKPGTPVVLPRREDRVRRSSIRTQPKPEEVIEKLEKTIRRQRIIMTCGAVILIAAIAVLGWLLYEAHTAAAIGSNYTTIPPVQ